MDVIRKEQIASQIVAIMQADWQRPSANEMKEILAAAGQQIDAISAGSQGNSQAQEPVSIVHRSAS